MEPSCCQLLLLLLLVVDSSCSAAFLEAMLRVREVMASGGGGDRMNEWNDRMNE